MSGEKAKNAMNAPDSMKDAIIRVETSYFAVARPFFMSVTLLLAPSYDHSL